MLRYLGHAFYIVYIGSRSSCGNTWRMVDVGVGESEDVL